MGHIEEVKSGKNQGERNRNATLICFNILNVVMYSAIRSVVLWLPMVIL